MTEKGIAKILPNDMVLSPLAGYTDAGFRTLAKDFGCGLTVTEMVSAKGLAMNNHVSRDLLYAAEKGVVAAQLFGGEPDAFVAALEKKCFDRFEIIDINMGCPQKKIVGNGEGCALMADVKRAEKIILAVKKSTDKLVTVKFRKGLGNENTAVEFAKMCEGAGADAITVHGRTSDEMFSGRVKREKLINKPQRFLRRARALKQRHCLARAFYAFEITTDMFLHFVYAQPFGHKRKQNFKMLFYRGHEVEGKIVA